MPVLELRRREFIIGFVGGVAVTSRPFSVRAQQTIRRVAVLMGGHDTDPLGQARLKAFLQGFRQLGWTDEQNVRLDIRWSQDNTERTREIVAEFVALKPDVILAHGTPAVAALKPASTGHQVDGSSQTDCAQPQTCHYDLQSKDSTYYPLYLSAIEKAASTLAVELTVIEIQNDAEIERAMNTLAREPDTGLIVMPDSSNMAHRQTIIAFADRDHVPAIYYFPLFATDGGLISYGPDEVDMFRRTAGYVDRILKGAKVGDLPVQQPTSFRLVINRKTAKTIGIQIPVSLLACADEVIE
jgi:putative ABC transport system substrate-binding protein